MRNVDGTETIHYLYAESTYGGGSLMMLHMDVVNNCILDLVKTQYWRITANRWDKQPKFYFNDKERSGFWCPDVEEQGIPWITSPLSGIYDLLHLIAGKPEACRVTSRVSEIDLATYTIMFQDPRTRLLNELGAVPLDGSDLDFLTGVLQIEYQLVGTHFYTGEIVLSTNSPKECYYESLATRFMPLLLSGLDASVQEEVNRVSCLYDQGLLISLLMKKDNSLCGRDIYNACQWNNTFDGPMRVTNYGPKVEFRNRTGIKALVNILLNPFLPVVQVENIASVTRRFCA